MLTTKEYVKLIHYIHDKECAVDKSRIYGVQSFCNPRTNTISDITISFMDTITETTKFEDSLVYGIPNKKRFRYGNCNLKTIKEWINDLYKSFKEDSDGSKI